MGSARQMQPKLSPQATLHAAAREKFLQTAKYFFEKGGIIDNETILLELIGELHDELEVLIEH